MKGLAKLTPIIAATLVLAGCTVGPKYNRPAVAAPPTFRGDTATTPDQTSLADAKWFEVFKDPQLQELIRTALTNNYDLREAVVRVDAARAALGVTRADQLPTITAGGNVTSQRFAQNGSFPIAGNVDTTRTFGTVGLNLLSYEIDLWGRLRRATEA